MTTNLFSLVSEKSYESVVQKEGCDLLITANAGSGKTRLLVERYLHLLSEGNHPRSIIAFTFTEKAARQLKERILDSLQQHSEFSKLPTEVLADWKNHIHRSAIGTIHQFCLRILRESTGLNNPFQGKIIDEAAEIHLRETQLNQILEKNFEQGHWATEKLLPKYGMPLLRNALRAVLLKRSEDTLLEEEPGIPSLGKEESQLFEALLALAAEVQEKIEDEKTRKQWLSFDDLELRALQEIKTPGESILNFLLPLNHLLVDEFQDTSPTQIALIEALQDFKKQHKQPLFLFAVGDPKQSIYRFRDVDRLLIEKTQKQILDGGGEAYALPRNFRSLPSLVDLTNHFSERAFPKERLSQAERPPASFRQVHAVILRTGEKKPDRSHQQKAEAQWIAGKILETHRRGRPWDQIAVLFRAAASALPLIDRLKELKIPYTLRGGRNLHDRQEILDLKNLLNFLSDPNENLYLVGILRSPLFQIPDAVLFFLTKDLQKGESLAAKLQGLSESELVKILDESLADEIPKILWVKKLLRQWLNQAPMVSPHAFLRTTVEELDLRRLYEQKTGDWDAPLAIEQFLAWLKNLELELNGPALKEVVKILRQLGKTPALQAPLGDLLEGSGCVHLLTIHSAKGLEFPTVLLMDLARPFPAKTQGVLWEGGRGALRVPNPLGDWQETERYSYLKEKQRQEDLEENKRLLYVALTRAGDELFIPFSENPRGKNHLQGLLLDHLDPSYRKSLLEDEKVFIASETPPAPDAESDRHPPEGRKESRKFPLPSLTVSQLDTLIQCPIKFYLAHQAGLSDQAWDFPGIPDHTVLGTLLHKALNVLQMFPQKGPGDVLQYLLRTEPLWNREIFLADLTASLEKYLQSNAYRLVAEAQEDHSELPFLLKLKNGFLRGQIDRLVQNKNQWFLIDFKFTKKRMTTEQIRKNYGFQLKTYALAAQRLLQGVLPRIEVHLLGQQEAHSLPLTVADLESHQRFLEEKMREWGKIALENVKKNESCFSCPFHRISPICPVPKGRSVISLHGSRSFGLMRG